MQPSDFDLPASEPFAGDMPWSEPAREHTSLFCPDCSEFLFDYRTGDLSPACPCGWEFQS
jgi:hypothetical protein